MEDPSREIVGPVTWSQKAGAGKGYPPYRTDYKHPPPPSVANTIVSGRDVRRSRKPSRPRDPVAKPPLPRSVRDAKVKPPRTIDVNLEGQEWRADRKCYKKHTICLSERLDRLSRPRRRYIINQWRDYHNVLSPEQINKLHEMLCCEVPKSCKPFNPDQAYDFFKEIKPKKKKKCSKKKRKQNKDLMLLCGNRGLSWARNAVVAVARGIQLKLGRPGCCVLKDSMQRLSDIILSEMAGYMGYKCRPSRRSNNTKSKFMVEMADKIAVWIDEIMSDAEARMLLMDFDDDEDVLFSDRPSLLGDYGDGSGPKRGPLGDTTGVAGSAENPLDPDGRSLKVALGPDGKPLLGPDGKPLYVAVGSDGNPLVGPDGKPLYTAIGPAGKPILVGADGKPILGPGGDPLQAALGPDGRPLTGPDGKPLYTTLGLDGKLILVGSDGKPVLGPGGNPLQAALGPDGRPLIGPDGKHMYTTIGPDGKSILVGADGKPILGPGGNPLKAALGPDGKPLVGPDGKPMYTTIGSDGKPMLVGADGKPILGKDGKPLQAAVDPDRTRLIDPLPNPDGKPLFGTDAKHVYTAVGSDDKPNASDGIPLHTEEHTQSGIDSDGKSLTEPGKPLQTALGPDGKPLFGPDGKPLYSTIGPDGKPMLVGADGKPILGPAGKPLQSALGPDGKPLFDPDGKPLYSTIGPDGKPMLVGADGKPILGPAGKPLQSALGPDGKPLFGPDGKPLYSTIGPDGKPMLVGADGKPILGPAGKPLQSALGPDGKPLFGPDGNPLYSTIGPDGKPMLVGADGKPILGPAGKPLQPALGPDGKPLFGPDGKPLYSTIGPDGKPLLVGADGKTMSVSADEKPKLVGADGKPLFAAAGPAGERIQNSVSPGGKMLQVEDGKPVPDGQKLYSSVGPDGQARLADADGKHNRRPLQAALGPDGKPLFGPDGKPLYTAIGPDGKSIFVGADGKPVLGSDGKPLQIAFGPDGKPLLGPAGKPVLGDADVKKPKSDLVEKVQYYRGDPKLDLISEMQKKFDEKLVDTPRSPYRESSETYFYSAQRLKMAQLAQKTDSEIAKTCRTSQLNLPARWLEKKQEEIKEKLKGCIASLSVPKSQANDIREFIPKVLRFLSIEVDKPVPEIEAFIALLKKMDKARDEPMVEGNIPMTRGEVSDYLKSVPTYEDTINKQDPALKKQVKDQMQDFVKTLPPSQAYSKADMDKVIDHQAGLLASYITHQKAKTKILEAMVLALAKDPLAVLLRHGAARMTNQDAANVLQGKNTAQLAVNYRADDIVARKLTMNLGIIAGRTAHNKDPVMPDLLEDLTDYLAQVLLQPKAANWLKK